jgi:hypothetical protein
VKPTADKDSILSRFVDGPALLRRTLAGLDQADLDAVPPGGGWTIRQIVHHVSDGDDLWKTGIKQALGNEQSEFSLEWYRTQPQETWADRWAYGQRPIEVSLSLLQANRDLVVELLEHVPDGWNRSVGFREPGGEVVRVSVGFVVEMQANHLVHHVERITAILRSM